MGPSLYITIIDHFVKLIKLTSCWIIDGVQFSSYCQLITRHQLLCHRIRPCNNLQPSFSWLIFSWLMTTIQFSVASGKITLVTGKYLNQCCLYGIYSILVVSPRVIKKSRSQLMKWFVLMEGRTAGTDRLKRSDGGANHTVRKLNINWLHLNEFQFRWLIE